MFKLIKGNKRYFFIMELFQSIIHIFLYYTFYQHSSLQGFFYFYHIYHIKTVSFALESHDLVCDPNHNACL
jgi:hypothetical protein